MSNKTKEIILVENYSFGLWLGEDGVEYFFNYSDEVDKIEEDTGCGALSVYPKEFGTTEETVYFEILDTEEYLGDNGQMNMKVTIKLNN